MTEDTLPIRVRFEPYPKTLNRIWKDRKNRHNLESLELFHIKLYDNMGEIPYITGQAMKQVGYAMGWTSYRLFPKCQPNCTVGAFAGLRMTEFEFKRHIVHTYTRMAQNSFENMIKMSEVKE